MSPVGLFIFAMLHTEPLTTLTPNHALTPLRSQDFITLEYRWGPIYKSCDGRVDLKNPVRIDEECP